MQDQVELSRHVQVLGGVRFDRFDLTYHNNRNGDTLGRTDNLVSPRAGVVFKPVAPLSIYGSYSVSYLPSSGDQFSSLTTITEQLEAGEVHELRSGREVGRRPGPLADDGRLPAGSHEHAIDRSERSDAHRPDRQPAHQRLRAGRRTAASRRGGRSPAATPIRTHS